MMEIKNNIEYLSLENGIRVITPKFYPRSFPLHCHQCIEIVALLETTGSQKSVLIRVNQTLYQLETGDILFIWPGELHEVIEADTTSPMAVQYDTYLIQNLTEFSPYINLFRSFQHISKNEMPELSNSLMIHLHKMASIQQEYETFYKTKCVIYLIEMFMAFTIYLNKDNNSSIKHSRTLKTMDKINDACSYMIAHCQKELTLETVANYVGFNACYFSRVFKEATRFRFVEYLMLQRVNAAQLLLTKSDKTITEIAFASGFKSISSFNRVFKQYRGCSPREYRQVNQAND